MKTSQKKLRLLGIPQPCQKEWVEQLASSKYLEQGIDCYNQGPLVEQLETRTAKLLGKQSALFFSKGVTAQLCALKVSTSESRTNRIALHPKSHIALDEQDAYQSLMGLEAELIGENDAPFTFLEVCQIKHPIACLSVELPLRRVGFKLPPWIELEEMCVWAEKHDVHFHLDGARLWESSPHYEKTVAEISDLFDSVYVSFYKGLGSIGGAILAGNESFIHQCKAWRSRMGGDNFTAFPQLVTSLEGLDNRLDKIPDLVLRAKAIAEQLQEIPAIQFNMPQANGFFIFVEGDLDALNQRATQLNHAMGIQLFNGFVATEQPAIQMAEIQVGPEHHTISDQEVFHYFQALLDDKA